MRLICYWQQRQLAQHLVTGESIRPTSSLAKHLMRCAACSEAHRDLTHLQREIEFVLPRATLSMNFESTLQQRLRMAMESAPRYKSYPSPAQVWGLLTLSGVILVVGWQGIHIHSPRTVGNQTGLASPTGSGHLSKSDVPITSIPVEPVRRAATTIKEHPALHQPHIPLADTSNLSQKHLYASVTKRHHRREGAIQKDVPSPTTPVVQIVYTTSSWQEAAQVYIAFGDHGAAYRAYAGAFAETPDLDTGIAACDSAAESGDISLAMATYAHLLSMGTESARASVSNDQTANETISNEHIPSTGDDNEKANEQ